MRQEDSSLLQRIRGLDDVHVPAAERLRELHAQQLIDALRNSTISTGV
jgi:hypothetical protein